nr:efflux RND transporter periplasmic adaptor subunit [Microbulbifer guangxiensis]
MFGKMMMNRAFDTMALPPATVTSAAVEQQTWQERLTAVGTLRAVNGVDVTSQAQGVVSAIHFQSGETVQEGALLVELAAEPERAQLKVLEAELQLARRDYERIRKLHGRGVTTDAELDDALSTLEQVLASIEVQRATVAERRVKAPFSGQLGIRQVDLGQNVSPGDAVVSLQQLAPIYADFSLPEQHFARVQSDQPVTLRTGAYPEKTFSGQVSAIDSRVDNESRNFLIQATLPNDGLELRPGMYADITLELAAERSVLVLPRTAIRFAPYGNSVFVLQRATEGEGYIANRRVVETGEERGDLVEIRKGVQPGEQVATSGLLKLRNEGAVIINNENKPPADMTPTPENR